MTLIQDPLIYQTKLLAFFLFLLLNSLLYLFFIFLKHLLFASFQFQQLTRCLPCASGLIRLIINFGLQLIVLSLLLKSFQFLLIILNFLSLILILILMPFRMMIQYFHLFRILLFLNLFYYFLCQNRLIFLIMMKVEDHHL
jgi:hypothetical protein